MKNYWELVERQVEKTAAMLQEGRANYSIIVLKEGKVFSSWCRSEDDAMVLLMAAILLRTGRRDVHQLLDAIGDMNIDEIDEIVEENLEEGDDEGGGGQ